MQCCAVDDCKLLKSSLCNTILCCGCLEMVVFVNEVFYLNFVISKSYNQCQVILQDEEIWSVFCRQVLEIFWQYHKPFFFVLMGVKVFCIIIVSDSVLPVSRGYLRMATHCPMVPVMAFGAGRSI